MRPYLATVNDEAMYAHGKAVHGSRQLYGGEDEAIPSHRQRRGGVRPRQGGGQEHDRGGQREASCAPQFMAAEDFGFYSQRIPAAFFSVGVRNAETGKIHHVH